MNSNLECTLSCSNTSNLSQLWLKMWVTHLWRKETNLMVLDPKDIMESVAVTVRKVETIYQDQYSKIVERLSKFIIYVTDPLLKKKLPLFSDPAMEAPWKGTLHRHSMNNDCYLFSVFSWLCMACQAWYGDVDRFLKLAHHLCHWEANCGLAQTQTDNYFALYWCRDCRCITYTTKTMVTFSKKRHMFTFQLLSCLSEQMWLFAYRFNMTHVGLLVNHLDFCNTNNAESLALITYGIIQVKMV